MQNNIVRILNVVPNMRAAGIETFVMNVYRNIDRSKVQFDFLVHSQKKEFFDDEIERMGGRIYRLTLKDDKNFIKYIKDLDTFFKVHKEYKIVHGHMQSMMPIYLKIAQRNGVPVRIAHSHNNDYEKSLKGFLLHLLSRFSEKYSTVNFACSKLAGEYLFNKPFEVIYNGIDIEKFVFDENVRREERKKLNLEDKFIVGFIGRLEKQKNPIFALKVFKEIRERRDDSILLIFGKGSLNEKIRHYIEENSLSDSVRIMGVKSNIERYISTFDAFLCPSLYEGLGIVLVENQYMLRPVYTTAYTVAEETKISNLINYIPLDYSPLKWAEIILNRDTITDVRFIDKKRFDIRRVSEKLEDFYLKYWMEE